jgi:hypothetical protein|tara:strand:+ start:322 stop:597 length:276 start_codon:yes stop_codon:yes gene_type:complete
MSIFKKKALPQSYQPVLQAQEIIDVFSRLTLHHQAALLRLISRNMVIQVGGRNNMGYEFKYEVDGAVIVVSPESDWVEEEQPQAELPLNQP